MKPVFKPTFSGSRAALSDSVHKEERKKYCSDGILQKSKEKDEKQLQVNQNTGFKQQSLTDVQYNEIFESVLARAASGLLTDTQESKNEVYCPNPAEVLAQRILNMSPTIGQSTNEVTPTTSPPGDEHTSPKQILKRPTKTKLDKPSSGRHNKKSLEYQVTTEKSADDKKKLKFKDKKRRKSDEHPEKTKKKYLAKGMWVQCCAKSCLKWRFLPDCADPTILPEFWICSLNPDKEQSSCSAPEVDWTSSLVGSEDHFIYAEYNAGSIVWAKMPGYPPWPAMVDSDPDTNLFYEYDESGMVLRYHVVFLDDHVSRAWIPRRCIEPYTKKKFKMMKIRDFKEELLAAVSVAETAMQQTLEERLQKYNFEKRFFSGAKHVGSWTAKRSSRKQKDHTRKSQCKSKEPVEMKVDDSVKLSISEELNQVVPNVSSSSTGDTMKASSCDDEKAANYWENASDSIDENSKESSEITKKVETKKDLIPKDKDCEYRNDDNKENKPPVTKARASPEVHPPKHRKKPSFLAPSRSQASRPDARIVPAFIPAQRHSRDVCAKARTGGTKEDAGGNAPEAICFDSEIYTMELEKSTERALLTPRPEDDGSNESLSHAVELDRGDSSAKSGSIPDEPLDLSQKHDSTSGDVPDGNNDSPQNFNISAEDFWIAPAMEKDKEVDDPFLVADLDVEPSIGGEDNKLLQEWDECKLQQLDELMPAIAEY